MDARMELIEAAYRFDLSEAAQLTHLVNLVAKHHEPERPLLGFTSTIRAGRPMYRASAVANADLSMVIDLIFDERAAVPMADIERMYELGPARQSNSTLLSTEYCETVVALGIPEFVGVTCPTGTGSALVIGARYDEPYVVPTAERAYWHAIAHHFASGLRLREVVSRPIDAVFRVDEGSPVVEHLSPDAALPSHREALRAAAIRREESRRGRRSDHEAAWPALIAGRWTLIDRFEEHGRRYLLAVRNPAGPSGGPRLDQRETAVIDAVARGEANKSIAIDLGMSEATISRAVRTALRKLGIAIADLIAARNAFTAPISLRGAELDVIPLASAASWIEELTPGERASVGGVLRGHSTATIARGRGVSKRTVTNQLASAFEKLGVRSRRELILLLSR